MDRAAESSSNFGDSVSSYIAKQKRQAAMGYIGGKIWLLTDMKWKSRSTPMKSIRAWFTTYRSLIMITRLLD